MGGHGEIGNAAGTIGGATLVSRVLGYLRDVIIANLFGAGLSTDAFIVANRIPNYLRRLLGEGTLNASLVPVFTEYLETKSRPEAWKLANVVISVISGLLTVVVLLGMIFTPGVVRVIAPGFSDNPAQFSLTVLLTRVMFPFALFMGLAAAFMGILNSLKHFGSPALAPAFLNIAVILCALFLTPFLSVPILSLSIGVLLGGILQFLVQIPFLIRKGYRFRPSFEWAHPGLRRVAQLMMPVIIGQSVLQINLFVSSILASFLVAGSISYLFFADRLVQFPLALFGFSAATAMLPTLSKHAAANSIPDMVDALAHTMRMVLFLMVPSMIGLAVLRVPIISVLFERGNFDHRATLATASALLYYSVGLWAFSEVRVVAQAFYALQDTLTPMKIGALAVAANIILSLLLMTPMGHNGLALANSLASILNMGLLLWVLRSRIGGLQGRRFLYSLIKILVASTVMGFCAYYAAHSELWSAAGQGLQKTLYLARGLFVGVITYIVMCLVLRIEEFRVVRAWIWKPAVTKGS